MIRTNPNAYKAKVFPYLLGCIYDENMEGKTPTEQAQHLFDMFKSQYCHPYEIQRTPNHQERLGQWLAGLPINIDYNPHQIIELAEQWAETTYTEKQAAKIVDNWFNFMGLQCLRLFDHYGIDQDYN